MRDTPMHDSGWISEREATQLLGFCRKTLFLLRKAGKLSFVRVGRSIRYRQADLEAFEQQNVVGA